MPAQPAGTRVIHAQRPVGWALFAALLLLIVAGIRLVDAEPQAAAAEPLAHGSFLAMYVPNAAGRQGSRLSTVMEQADGRAVAGASAAFGWMEDGDQVLLIVHRQAVPSLSLARAQRVVETARPIRALSELPRYLMICTWDTAAGQAGRPTVAYAERDDANMRSRKTRRYANLNVPWVPTASKRVAARFAGHDYCGEIARTGQSAARLWRASGEG